jgi:hypothetical protein
MRSKMFYLLPHAIQDLIAKGFKVSGSYTSRTRGLKPKIKFTLDGTMKSGHNDTSLSNGVNNGQIVAATAQHLKINVRALVAGDDLLVASQQPVPLSMENLERSMGIVPEAARFEDPEHVSFISGIFMKTAFGFAFLPKPGRLLAKLFWTVKPISNTDVFRRCVSITTYEVMQNMPIIKQFLELHCPSLPAIFSSKTLRNQIADAHAYLRASKGGWYEPFDKQDYSYQEGYDFLLRRYGLASHDIDELIDFIVHVPSLPCSLEHPIAQRMINLDTADLDQRPGRV